MALYSYRECEKLINHLEDLNYWCCQVWDGCLGIGDWICWKDNSHYTYIIKEVYLNEWSSAQTIRRYRRLPKKYAKALDDYKEW